MKNSPESGEFCCLHICLFKNGKAIHFRTTLTPLRLLFLLYILSYCSHVFTLDESMQYFFILHTLILHTLELFSRALLCTELFEIRPFHQQSNYEWPSLS